MQTGRCNSRSIDRRLGRAHCSSSRYRINDGDEPPRNMMTRLSALALLLFLAAPAAAQTPSGGATSSIGYASVAAALASLRVQPGVDVAVQAGWTVIQDRANLTI